MIGLAEQRDLECLCNQCKQPFSVTRGVTSNGLIVGGEDNVPQLCDNCRRHNKRRGTTFAKTKCPWCGSDVQHDDHQNARIYCSESCRENAKRERDRVLKTLEAKNRLERVNGPCPICGNTWTGRKIRLCPQCRSKYGPSAIKGTCVICGHEYIRKSVTSKTCSIECGTTYRSRQARKARAVSADKWRSGRGRALADMAEFNRRTANVAEAMWDLLCAVRGWENAVVHSASSSRGYDRLCKRASVWETVQVKALLCGNSKNSCVHLKGSQQAYKTGDFDLLAAIDTMTGDAWLIPWVLLDGRHNVKPNSEQFAEFKTHIMFPDSGVGVVDV